MALWLSWRLKRYAFDMLCLLNYQQTLTLLSADNITPSWNFCCPEATELKREWDVDSTLLDIWSSYWIINDFKINMYVHKGLFCENNFPIMFDRRWKHSYIIKSHVFMVQWWQVLQLSGARRLAWRSASGKSSNPSNPPGRLMNKKRGLTHRVMWGNCCTTLFESFKIWIRRQALPIFIVCGGVMWQKSQRGRGAGQAGLTNLVTKSWLCGWAHSAQPGGREEEEERD